MFFLGDRSRSLTRELLHKFGIGEVNLWIQIGLELHHSKRIIGHRKADAVRTETNNRCYIEKSWGERSGPKKEGIRSRRPEI